jgi:hypothetical protein
MQRSHLLRCLALAIGLFGTQCLDSISDDCTKTLTCPDDQQPTLREDCTWRYPSGALWQGAPQYDVTTRKWRWPDGKETATQEFKCDLGVADAGTDAGPTGPDCRLNITCDDGQVCDPATGGCFECVGDADCAGNMAMGDAGAFTVCDTLSHRCVECVGDQNCSGDTGVCKRDEANSRRNTCVECIDGTTCGPASPICDERANDCTSTCQSAAECTGDKKACNTTRNICVECTDNTTCTTGTELLCDTESNLCVECLNDVPCAADGRVCDLESHTCVACQLNEQCPTTDAPFCETESHECVQCLNDQQCTTGTASRCNSAHVCTGCTDNSQCEGGAQCRSGVCVECTTNLHCTNPAEPVCETSQGVCVGCLNNAQCRNEEAAHCELGPDAPANTLYTCVGCVGNQDCTGDGKGLPPFCDTVRGGICSECLGEADCVPLGVTRSACTNGTCSICTLDSECNLFPSTPACKPDFGCVQCTESGDCSDTIDTPICKINPGAGAAAINTCVQCLTNADCQANAGASLCQDNQCVPCVADGDCSLVDNNGNDPGGIDLAVCDAGTCVECTGVKNGGCQNGTNACISSLKTCSLFPEGSAGLCETCVADNHCAASARCVQQANLGLFCMPLQTQGACPATGPTRGFLQQATSATIDAPSAALCTPRLATCPAFVAYRAGRACDDATDDDACGQGGSCEQVPGGGDDFLCTIPCAGVSDCLSGSCLDDLCTL